MNTIIFGIITKVVPIPNPNSQILEYEIYGKNAMLAFSDASTNNSEFLCLPTSQTPFNVAGGGGGAKPNVNDTFIGVIDLGNPEDVCHILAYNTSVAQGQFGAVPSFAVPDGGKIEQYGGYQPLLITTAPGYWRVRSDDYSDLSVDGNLQLLKESFRNTLQVYVGGYISNTHYQTHAASNLKNLHSYWEVHSREAASNDSLMVDTSILGDYANKETEETHLMSPPLPTPKAPAYDNKVIIRAGNIFNMAQKGADMKQTHVYQIETRQATAQKVYKDTVSVLRMGWQDSHKRFTASDTIAPGTLLEWTAKLNDPTPIVGKYDSYVLRLGEFTSGKTEGEIYRLQIYNKVVDPIGDVLKDYMGEGLGYDYKFFNKMATQQFTQSFGTLTSADDTYLSGSFHRVHVHNFPGLNGTTSSMFKGVSYSHWLGGKSEESKASLSQTNVTKWVAGDKALTLDYSFEDSGKFSIVKNAFKPESHESIVMNKDNFTIEVKSDTATYTIAMTGGKIVISLKGGSDKVSPCITLSNDGKIVVNPGTGNSTTDSIYLGGVTANGQHLVTESWVKMLFDTHFHQTTTPGAPTLPPTRIMTPLSKAIPTTHLTYITKVE